MKEKEPYAQRLLSNLNALRLEGTLCDVEILSATEDEFVYAHRSVLAAASPYFHAMFNGGLAENNKETIVLRSLDANTLRGLIGFIYSGSLPLNHENVQEILISADMIGLPEVVNLCTDYLVSEMDSSNVISVYLFASDHHCLDLKSISERFIFENFVSVSKESEEFATLSKDILLSFLKSENLRVDSETQVFIAAMDWITTDISKRRRFVFDIIKYIRLPLVPLTFIDSYIQDTPDISLKVALSSVKRDMINGKGNLVSSLSPIPREAAKRNIYLIGGGRREIRSAWTRSEFTFHTVEMFDTFASKWKKATTMKVGRILPGLAILNGKIYVCGGELESEIFANGEIYDPIQNSWSSMAPMTIPRCEFGMTALNEFIYAFGGWVGEDIGGSIERYDPRSNQWTVIAEMLVPRFSMGIISYEGLIYIVGGCTNTRMHMQELVSFNPETNEWTNHASMLVPRSQMGCAVLEHHLYVVGGTNRKNDVLQSVERYSFNENKWEEIPPMSEHRASPCVAAANGKLYVFGGDQINDVNFYRSRTTISSSEVFDPATNSWKESVSLPESRSEAGAIVL
ncbi:actin-binding protein IPP [Lepeophtheirus salmonis]|uniref:Kelch-like protein diablo n=2 Tax=Lepeophtheirus salmonis TaxID=72036 RepID=A0A0K2UCK7_LEPSM|nr:actin-binding protein IPP-like [Lepeophtheirus salmonis]XP_040580406.1 actin-binding protein IPP-like [Lepeophtheirus salmonis]XP_040580407.1 actin-binding protein IPP-like [Lepeophtheirus salmonis]